MKIMSILNKPARLCMLAVMITALVLALVGCDQYKVGEGSYGATRVHSPMSPQTRVQLNNVALLDASIAGKLAVERSGARRNPTGTLEAWATLRNRTDFPIQVEGRVQFFDENEAPVEGPTTWQRIYLPPQGISHYKESSYKVYGISYYFIEIREGR